MKKQDKNTVVNERRAYTADELALVERIKQEDREWETITEEDIDDFSLAEDPYKLPREAADMQARGKFAFRWAVADAKRLDELRSAEVPARWWICNAVNTPFLEKYCDPLHGGIQKHDQVLLFKPWWMHVAYKEAKLEIAKTRDRAGDISNRDGLKDENGTWYAGKKAALTSADEVVSEFEGDSDMGGLVVNE